MLRKTLTSAVLAVGVLTLGVAAGCQSAAPAAAPAPAAQPAPAATAPVSIYKAGESVLAIWSSATTWYEGTVGASCPTGVLVTWSDGSAPTCNPDSKIAPNKPVAKADAKVGAKVYAQWSGTGFYEAEITKVSGDMYTVKYTSDSTTKDSLKLTQLRAK